MTGKKLLINGKYYFHNQTYDCYNYLCLTDNKIGGKNQYRLCKYLELLFDIAKRK